MSNIPREKPCVHIPTPFSLEGDILVMVATVIGF